MKLQSLLLENLVSNTHLFIGNGIRGETCELFISSDLMPEMHSQLPRPFSRHLSWLARHSSKDDMSLVFKLGWKTDVAGLSASEVVIIK